jgi:hypothetical protein
MKSANSIIDSHANSFRKLFTNSTPGPEPIWFKLLHDQLDPRSEFQRALRAIGITSSAN